MVQCGYDARRIIRSWRISPSPQKKQPDCNTLLPNGKTVGQIVQSAVSSINGAAGDYDIGGVGEIGAFVATVQSNGPIDFKNNFKGSTGYSARFLGDAGNFAYGAIASATVGRVINNVFAGAYGLKTTLFGSRKFSDLHGPFLMDTSAYNNSPRGYATQGCTR